MEEKLDVIIRLLEKQNGILERLEKLQTTNKSVIQEARHINKMGYNVGMRTETGSKRPMAGSTVQEMINKARADAERKVQESIKELKIDAGFSEE